MSGETEKLQYYVSGSYLNQNGNLRYGNDNMKRYNLSAKINTKINKYIDFNLSTKFIRYDLDNPIYLEEGGLLYHDIARMWPTMPFKDPNGHYMRNGKLAQLTDGGRSKTHNDDIYLQGQVILHPLKNWNIYAEAGMRVINQNKQVNLNKIYEYDINDNPVELAFSGSYAPGATFARMNYLNSNFYTTSFYTDYTLEKNDHYLKVMLGMNTEEYIVRSLSAQRSDVISGLIPEISASVGEDKINNDDNNPTQYRNWATAGFFGRINYSYKERYLAFTGPNLSALVKTIQKGRLIFVKNETTLNFIHKNKYDTSVTTVLHVSFATSAGTSSRHSLSDGTWHTNHSLLR